MLQEDLQIACIFPGDTPRTESQEFIEIIWGQEGPSQEIIDLTLNDLSVQVCILEDGTYYCENGNNRLWYLCRRCGPNQIVRVNIRPTEMVLDDNLKIYENTSKFYASKGIKSFNDYEIASKLSPDRTSYIRETLTFSPFK